MPSTKKRNLNLELHNTTEDERATQPRKGNSSAAGGSSNLDAVTKPSPKKPRKNAKSSNTEEKRLRPFRNHPPKSYLERLDRVQTQRMFLLDRSRYMAPDGTHEEEVFDITGTTGNIYQVTVSTWPNCTCPDNAKGNQCKHIVYVMVNILKAPPPLSYQLALLTTELATIFAAAPPTPHTTPAATNPRDPSTTNDNSNRKAIEGDCPVCVMEFTPVTDDIIWCRAACGNNIHRECFEAWACSKSGQVRCVYCRAPWAAEPADIGKLKGVSTERNAEGYVNVAAQLGLSGRRDMSSYYQHWARRQYPQAMYHDEDFDGG